MKTFLKIGVLAAALTFSGNLAAQENMQTDNSNLLRFYDSELFQWDYSMFGGLTLNFQNQSAITIYGIKEPMKKAFLLYEDTSQQYRAYRGKNIAGNVLMWGGLTAVLAGTCIPINWQDGSYKNNLEAAAGLILGGAVAELIGLLVLQSGQENIFNAVNMYNRHKMNEYK
jgi:hypothetical protein